MKLSLVVFLLLCYCTQGISQYKQMLHKPYKDKVEGIDSLYRNTINKGIEDSLYIKKYAKQIEKFAIENQDEELALEANLLYAYSYWYIYGHKNHDLIYNLIDVAQKGKNKKVAHIEERAAHTVATYYWRKKEYEKSFEWLLRSAKVLETMKPESFPNMAEHLNFIGYCYYYFKDFSNALIYYNKSSKLEKTKFNANAVLDAQNTLGLCYQKLKDLKLAERFFLMIINDSSAYQNDVWKRIASGNLGYNFFLEKNYKNAIPLLEKDIQNAIKIGDIGFAAGSAIPLADIYLQQKKLDKAKQKIEEAKTYIQKSGQTDRFKELYPVMSKWYAANKQIDSSSVYLDSTINAINTYYQKYNSIKLIRANQKVQVRDWQLEIEKLHTESRLKISQRNNIILIIALLLIGSLCAYWFRNKYHLRKQEIKELRIENAEKALSNAKNQLQSLKLKIHDEQEIIESLQQQLQSKDNKKLICQLKSKIILTDEDWKKYQLLFDEIYPAYLHTLRSMYSNLTPSELRCLCLEKLELTNKEMGLVLGVSTNSVMVTKHRIRKKLGLKSQQDIRLLVRELS
ncbi:hypothetical protein JoomaDRAFT_3517 [Galbibacter orientalis DSM 19592]|uniref:HTH luxR-type domain-containing protein n=2 Tax=Galbibacter TaxID=379068 RepID=I3CA14_9FLAO|nr:hypothetical protein JoomaDRAFT_3517 [Galbibacter orientalis DSM 19592]